MPARVFAQRTSGGPALTGPLVHHNGGRAFRQRGCGSVIAASCAVGTDSAPMECRPPRTVPLRARPFALSAAQTAVDVNEAKNNEHGSSIHRDDLYACDDGRGHGYRTTNTGQSIWTTERVDQLRSCVTAGLTCSQIAAEIGVTRNAVIGKIHRLGLSPGRPRGRQPAALAQRMRASAGDARAPARTALARSRSSCAR